MRKNLTEILTNANINNNIIISAFSQIVKRVMMLSISIALLIGFANIMNPVEIKAQQDKCIDGKQIPAYYNDYTGQITRTFKVGKDCYITYNYCYRCDCPILQGKPDCSKGSVYYDCYISSIAFSGNCYGIDPEWFDEDAYNSLYAVCLTDLVCEVNPWKECDLHRMGANIPNCKEQSPVVYRAGRPSCTSALYHIWRDGRHWQKTAPCNTRELPYYCFNTYTFCWEFDKETGEKYLKSTQLGSGTPSSYYCPALYMPIDEEYDREEGPVECIPICGE